MTDPTPRIAELKDHVARTVTVRGWVTHVRSSGKVAFAVIRDGTGVMQAVFVKTQLPPEVWERFKELYARDVRSRERRGARRTARARRLRDGRDRAHRHRSEPDRLSRFSPRSTASTFCSTTGTSGSAARASARSSPFATRSSRPFMTSSMSGAFFASTRRS